MNVFIGECGDGPALRDALALGWGRMWIGRDRFIKPQPGERWALDNGAYMDWEDKAAPMQSDAFRGDLFMRSLDKAIAAGVPEFAVVPDLPGNPESYGFSLSWVDRMPAFPLYLAVQDGMTPDMVEPDGWAGIFLGGTDSYKATAGLWRDWAHAHGLRFHYGRCGTQEKVRHAIHVGADSIDSALPMMHPRRWENFKRWATLGPCQRDLFMV